MTSHSESSSVTAMDAEAQAPLAKTRDTHSYFSVLLDQAGLDDEVLHFPYAGHGTAESPYLVDFLPNDPRNPMTFSKVYKWVITIIAAVSTLAVAFSSSAYSGSVREIMAEFHVSNEVVILGVSMFVLGFAVGPLLWAPLSEMYGRQKVFFFTYLALTAFNAAAAGAQSMAALIVLRFFAGAFGSSPLANAGGVIADIFTANERGIAASFFAVAPFLGPALGPIAGGFLGESKGWRWVEGMTAIFTGILWIVNTFVYPETYAPTLLRKRADALSKMTGKVYMAKIDLAMPRRSMTQQFKKSLMRPWILLFKEPIVLLTSLYMAIVYGTLYLCFAAFPIVFQTPYPAGWGWSPGIGGLAFLGIAVGMVVGAIGAMIDNRRYQRVAANSPMGMAPPEARLPPAIVGSILLPVGLFWFAWTNDTNVHWAVPIVGSAFFAAGIIVLFLSLINYLIDSCKLFPESLVVYVRIANILRRHLCCFSSRGQLGLAIPVRHGIPALRHLHVQEPR